MGEGEVNHHSLGKLDISSLTFSNSFDRVSISPFSELKKSRLRKIKQSASVHKPVISKE